MQVADIGARVSGCNIKGKMWVYTAVLDITTVVIRLYRILWKTAVTPATPFFRFCACASALPMLQDCIGRNVPAK